VSHSSCCRALPRGRMATIPWPRRLQMMRTTVTSGKCTCAGAQEKRPSGRFVRHLSPARLRELLY